MMWVWGRGVARIVGSCGGKVIPCTSSSGSSSSWSSNIMRTWLIVVSPVCRQMRFFISLVYIIVCSFNWDKQPIITKDVVDSQGSADYHLTYLI